METRSIKSVTGILTEYNPLHAGHIRMMEEIRRTRGADTAIICCMSGDFVQRGDLAIVRRQARAKAAVLSGADLVLELPLPWAVSSAEGFAEGGVGLLLATGLVDTLAFGSESGDLAAIQKAAAVLSREEFSAALHGTLSAGISYPAARQRAAERLAGPETALILSNPNDLLGVEYCKAVLKYNNNYNNIKIMAIPRAGGGHDKAGSASEIRELLRGGDTESRARALNLMAPAMRECYLREEAQGRAPVLYETLERAILARLRSMTPEDWTGYDAGREGLSNRMYQAAKNAVSVREILIKAKTKRYPMARLRRMILYACLDLRQTDKSVYDNNRKNFYLRPLAMNRTGRILLARMRNRAAAPVITRAADWKKLNPDARRMLQHESKAADLYALAFPDLNAASGQSAPLREPPAIL